MSRQARVVAEAVPHHVTQRGNNRQDIFFTDDDRRFYLAMLREKSELFGLSILGYCLMTNHVHVIGVPRHFHSLAKALGQAHWRYAMYFNRRYRRSGHLWQNRYYSSPLGPSHLLTALAYVDLNPFRAGLVGDPAEYPWSSARAHLSGADRHRLLDEWEWSESNLRAGWGETLRAGTSAAADEALRHATANGLALGDDTFVAALEQSAGRRLRAQRRGRPRLGSKASAAAAGNGNS
jgi:putative transposase